MYGNGGRAAFIGYPTADGSVGSSFYILNGASAMAMTASCKDKEAACTADRR